MIKISDLSYKVKKQHILDDINLSIDPGNFFALAGENGAGKSTLIRLMLDLLRTESEEMIMINGQSSWVERNRSNLSYLPEKFQISKNVNGQQYLNFVSGIHQKKMNVQLVSDLCQQLEFNEEYLTQPVSHYSKGMMQKVGLISCFMLDRPLMILDEPLSGLDPKARYCLKQLLLKKKQQGMTLFYSTHMLADAEEISDQFAILDAGQLKFVGSPAECIKQFSADTLETAYINCVTNKV